MRNLLIVFGIVFILIGTIFITPALGNNINEDFEELKLNRKILLVVGGGINVCWIDKELYGYGIMVYTNGNTSFFTNYTIKFEGIPLFINNYILFAFCFYKPADR